MCGYLRRTDLESMRKVGEGERRASRRTYCGSTTPQRHRTTLTMRRNLKIAGLSATKEKIFSVSLGSWLRYLACPSREKTSPWLTGSFSSRDTPTSLLCSSSQGDLAGSSTEQDKNQVDSARSITAGVLCIREQTADSP